MSNPSILVVDDEEPVLKLITALLSMKPIRLRTANNASSALVALAAEAADVLITDHMMPGGTGLDLIERANTLYPDTVKILLTGVGDRDLYREAINRGAVFSLVEKPFRNQHLLDIIEKALDRRRSIVEKKREIEQLLERYRAIFDHTTDLIQSTDFNGGFLYVNPAWHHVLGYDCGELPNLRLSDIIHADWRERFEGIAEQVREGKRVERFETVMIARNGAPIYLEGNVISRHQKGETSAVSWMFRDVTERRKFTEQITARLKQETMIARIADLFARSEEPLNVYGAILKTLGESAGADVVNLYSLDDRENGFRYVESWVRSDLSGFSGNAGFVPFEELPFIRGKVSAGEVVSFASPETIPEPDRGHFIRTGTRSLLLFPVQIGAATVGVLGFHLLSTNRAWAESDVVMLGASVDIIANAWNRQVEIDARKAKEIEAEQSRLLVIRADRLAALGTMTAGIIHEITQPLNAISVSSQTILYGMSRGWKIDNEKVASSLNLVVEQVKRMSEIITNMRAFARDGFPAVREKGDLNEQIRRVFSLIGQQMKAHGIEVVLRLGDIPEIWINMQQIPHVILNLVTNARQALEEVREGDRRIIVSTRAENGMILLEVEDNGPGVPAEIREKIFDPFFTTKEVGRGTGLGLSISSGIVHDHNGQIDIRDNESGGATFIVRLPVAP